MFHLIRFLDVGSTYWEKKMMNIVKKAKGIKKNVVRCINHKEY